MPFPRWTYTRPGPAYPPGMVIELRHQTPGNLALLERVTQAAKHSNTVWLNATMYGVAFISMNADGNPEIGLIEL